MTRILAVFNYFWRCQCQIRR